MEHYTSVLLVLLVLATSTTVVLAIKTNPSKGDSRILTGDDIQSRISSISSNDCVDTGSCCAIDDRTAREACWVTNECVAMCSDRPLDPSKGDSRILTGDDIQSRISSISSNNCVDTGSCCAIDDRTDREACWVTNECVAICSDRPLDALVISVSCQSGCVFELGTKQFAGAAVMAGCIPSKCRKVFCYDGCLDHGCNDQGGVCRRECPESTYNAHIKKSCRNRKSWNVGYGKKKCKCCKKTIVTPPAIVSSFCSNATKAACCEDHLGSKEYQKCGAKLGCYPLCDSFMGCNSLGIHYPIGEVDVCENFECVATVDASGNLESNWDPTPVVAGTACCSFKGVMWPHDSNLAENGYCYKVMCNDGQWEEIQASLASCSSCFINKDASGLKVTDFNQNSYIYNGTCLYSMFQYGSDYHSSTGVNIQGDNGPVSFTVFEDSNEITAILGMPTTTTTPAVTAVPAEIFDGGMMAWTNFAGAKVLTTDCISVFNVFTGGVFIYVNTDVFVDVQLGGLCGSFTGSTTIVDRSGAEYGTPADAGDVATFMSSWKTDTTQLASCTV